ncbi:hypothetical protein D3C76_1535550 [compost metagenome]
MQVHGSQTHGMQLPVGLDDAGGVGHGGHVADGGEGTHPLPDRSLQKACFHHVGNVQGGQIAADILADVVRLAVVADL